MPIKINIIKGNLYHFLNNTTIGKFIINAWFKKKFANSASYWENRYLNNGTSGNGSYGEKALYKATVVNKFVNDNHIQKVIDFGCGDGNQLKQFKFPAYIGLDVSLTAVNKCASIFSNDVTKKFFIYNPNDLIGNIHLFKGDLVLSLDVIYHLVEDDVFEKYMDHLFSSSTGFVIIYAWDINSKRSYHVRHKQFTKWIAVNQPNWQLIQKIESIKLGACDFFIYQKLFS